MVLNRVNPDKPFVITRDASSYAVGAALEKDLGEDMTRSVEGVCRKICAPRLYVMQIDSCTM